VTVGVTCAVVLAFAIPLAFLSLHAVENAALDRARYQAESVAGFISAGQPDAGTIAGFLKHRADDSVGTTWVVGPNDQSVGSPPEGLTEDDLPGQDLDADGDGRIGDVDPAEVNDYENGAVTAVVTSTQEGQWTVYVYLTDDELHEGLVWRWALLGAASLTLIGLSALAGEVLARRLARPLEDTAETAHRLATGDVDARADTSGPREVAEVASALNLLADRIDEVIATERETVADLSHRLRTPLTALRLDIDALADQEEADRLNDHVTNLERSLTTVIHAARRPSREGRIPKADPVAVVEKRVAFWTPLVVDQGRRVDVDITPDLPPVRLSGDDLTAALDALIENVVAHTSEGTDFTVSLRGESGPDRSMVVLAVEDQGSGLPAGVGVRGRSDRGSTGLGLDIARAAAEASGGRMKLAVGAGGGARVELWLGPARMGGDPQAAHRNS
jgi:signal transduction histidine kinase